MARRPSPTANRAITEAAFKQLARTVGSMAIVLEDEDVTVFTSTIERWITTLDSTAAELRRMLPERKEAPDVP